MASNSPWHRLYNTKAWYRLRHHQLRTDPLCKYCQQAGRTKPAAVVDHIIPHKGDEALFFDPTNLQSLCKACHDGAKQREERQGAAIGCDVNGLPLDPGHHWHWRG